MARFLSPAKICLLALIELYVEGAIPSQSILPVLSFITSHLIDIDADDVTPRSQDRWQKAQDVVSLVLSLQDFDQLLSPYSAATGLPGRRLWDIFLNKLWAIDSLHALHEFFDRIQLLLAKTKDELRQLAEAGEQAPSEGIQISRNSPFGTFIRRSQLEFTRLRFSDVGELWKDFVNYRHPTASAWRRRNPAAGPLSFDNVLLAGELEWGAAGTADIATVAYGDILDDNSTRHLPVSTDDLENLLEFQIDQMQSSAFLFCCVFERALTRLEFGLRIPTKIRHEYSALLKESHAVPSTSHYLRFLEAWRSGDYPTSFDYLHQYFDYTMQSRDRPFYQYALMNLAVLQADFGCYKEAVDAMLETVSTARENRDMTCLNFALNWLFHFGQAHPHLVRELETNSMLGSGKESLAFLRVKAKETGMFSLWSSSLLSEAKLCLSNGDSVATALEYMVRSSQILVEKNMKNMMGSQLALNIALWDRLGSASMSAMTCQIFLMCHAPSSNFDDALKVTARLASLQAGRGRYDDAMSLLEDIDSNALRTWKMNQYWHKYRGLLKLRRDLHRNDLDGADYLLSQLLQSKPDDLEPDLVFIVDSLHIEALMRRGEFEVAFNKIEALMAEHREESKDISLRVRLLLMKAALYDKCGRPQKGFTIAMRAASIAWRARFMPLLWQAIGAIANILISLDEFDAAARLLVAIIPRHLECDTSFMVAQLYSYLADANMGMAGKSAPGSPKRMEFMTRASDAIKQAFDHFSRIEDVEKQCEMMAKQATIMSALGDIQLADDCAARYLELRRASVRTS